jgi:hypothetical protein
MGQSRRFDRLPTTSAPPPSTDIVRADRHVLKGANMDIASALPMLRWIGGAFHLPRNASSFGQQRRMGIYGPFGGGSQFGFFVRTGNSFWM